MLSEIVAGQRCVPSGAGFLGKEPLPKFFGNPYSLKILKEEIEIGVIGIAYDCERLFIHLLQPV